MDASIDREKNEVKISETWCEVNVRSSTADSDRTIVLQKDRDAELGAKWKHCAMSQEPLQQPIVACELGRYVA